jgi:hypothetical protein
VLSIKEIDYDTNDNIVCLLLCSTDKRKANPTFENATYGTMRTEKKRPGEGLSVTIHIMIDMDPSMGQRSHNCLVESVHGFSKSDFAPFLDVLARSLVPSQTIPDVEDGKDVTVKPKLVFQAIDENIEDDIQSENGAIKNIIFETVVEKGDGADEHTWVESVSKREVYKIKEDGRKDLNWAKSFIKDKFERNAKKYKNAKIVYTTSDKKSRTTELKKRKDDSISFAFGRVKEVILDTPINDAALASIDTGLYAKMKIEIMAER